MDLDLADGIVEAVLSQSFSGDWDDFTDDKLKPFIMVRNVV